MANGDAHKLATKLLLHWHGIGINVSDAMVTHGVGPIQGVAINYCGDHLLSLFGCKDHDE